MILISAKIDRISRKITRKTEMFLKKLNVVLQVFDQFCNRGTKFLINSKGEGGQKPPFILYKYFIQNSLFFLFKKREIKGGGGLKYDDFGRMHLWMLPLQISLTLSLG